MTNLIVEQFSEVQSKHPSLELLRLFNDSFCVEGQVGFSVDHDLGTTSDCYCLVLSIPNDYPAFPPYVFETRGKVPQGFGHFMAAGNLCLGAPVEVRRKFSEHKNLLKFIEAQVIPYLYSYSHLRDHGKLPFGDLRHGTRGLLQYYMEFFETNGFKMMQLLKCLADDFAPPLGACPCDSGRKLKRCHGDKLDALRPHMRARQFEQELRQMIKLLELHGIRYTKRVVPKRMLKQRRRSQKAKRR